MASWQNGKLTKWKLTKLLVYKMTIWQNGKLMNWKADKITSVQNDNLAKWES
jgi:hypothetical protein